MKYVTATLLVAVSMTGTVLFWAGDYYFTVYVVLLPILALVETAHRLLAKERTALFGTPVLVAMVVVATAIAEPTMRPSSVIYSFILITGFVLTVNGLRRFTQDDMLLITRIIIIGYAVNVLIGQVLVAAGVQNELAGRVIGYALDPRSNVVRAYGFSSEPSVAAFVLALTVFTYLRLQEARGRWPEWWIVVAVFYQVWAFTSLYGYLLTVIILGSEGYRRGLRWLPVVICIAVLAALLVKWSDVQAGSTRVARVAGAIVLGKMRERELRESDSSLSMRVVPAQEYFQNLSLLDWRTWVGHGPATSTVHYSDEYAYFAFKEAESRLVRLGFLPAFLYDFGLIGAGIVVWFIRRHILRGTRKLELAIVFLMLFNANFNTQVFWYAMVLLSYIGRIGIGEPARVGRGRVRHLGGRSDWQALWVGGRAQSLRSHVDRRPRALNRR